MHAGNERRCPPPLQYADWRPAARTVPGYLIEERTLPTACAFARCASRCRHFHRLHLAQPLPRFPFSITDEILPRVETRSRTQETTLFSDADRLPTGADVTPSNSDWVIGMPVSGRIRPEIAEALVIMPAIFTDFKRGRVRGAPACGVSERDAGRQQSLFEKL